jgi:uncharacterized RDD family membrane protein YckC
VSRTAPVGYVGLVTRGVAFLIDALVINVIAVLIGGLVNLIGSLLGINGTIDVVGAVLGAAAWWIWSLFYFVTFWALTGQTVGNRILGIRVIGDHGGRVTFKQAVRRFLALTLAIIPLGAGLIPILTDERRRGYHDRRAHTVVRWDVDEDTEEAVRSQHHEAKDEPAGDHPPGGGPLATPGGSGVQSDEPVTVVDEVPPAPAAAPGAPPEP